MSFCITSTFISRAHYPGVLRQELYPCVLTKISFLLVGALSQLSGCLHADLRWPCRSTTTIFQVNLPLEANLSSILPSPRFLLLPGFFHLEPPGFGRLLMFLSEVFNGWQQELGVPTQDWSRGVGSLGLFRLSFLAAFPTCNHRRTLIRLVLNEGCISAIDSYTILSAQVEPKN
jgi:hypothetical protein